MKTKILFISICSLFLANSAFAGKYATQLGQCLYNNSSSEDKTTLTQWAFVNLGKTKAAREISTIPENKTQEIDAKTKTLITKLLTSSCKNEALKVTLKEPTSGLQDAISTVASEMIKDQLASQTSKLFNNSKISNEKLQNIRNVLQENKSSLKNLFNK